MKPGSSGNLMFLISEFGNVLPMSSFRRTSDALFSHTWRNACLWAIQVVTRAGSSTIQPHKSISSQSVQNLTSASFRDWHSAEPEAEPPVIWSEEEDEDGEQANSASVPEPRTFKQAIHGEQSQGWREAATLEYNTLVETGTFEIVDLPVDQKAIGSGWVFRVKHNADGSIERLKARIVAKGYSQRPGLDYNESFAPTFRPATLRIIMAMAAVKDLELCSVDIMSAFTNG